MSDLLQPGQIFAERYRVQRYLAEGGMGAVFVAEQLATERIVAIKVLWPQILGSEKAVEQFQLEARIAARVQSEHIVQVLDAGLDKATKYPFLVMELLSGAPLQDVVEQKGPFSPDAVALLIRQVALGLDKAHGYIDQQGRSSPIIHRDLKPENLFLTYRESGEPHVKILDFGLAKVLSESAAVSQDLKGTPLYMAFEQATGERISAQTDVWALGLIAFFLLTGRVYWATAHRPEAGMQALFSEILTLPQEPASLRLGQLGGGTLPSGFDVWLARCIDRDPKKRFLSAGQAAAELSAIIEGRARVSTVGVFDATAVPETLVSTGVSAESNAEVVRTAPSFVPPASAGAESSAGSVAKSNMAVAMTQAPGIPKRGKAPVMLGSVLGLIGISVGAFFAFRASPDAEPVEPLVPTEARPPEPEIPLIPPPIKGKIPEEKPPAAEIEEKAEARPVASTSRKPQVKPSIIAPRPQPEPQSGPKTTGTSSPAAASPDAYGIR